jgi:hypothetical protein
MGLFENPNPQVITAQMLQNLPEPVKRYMDFTGVVGKPWIDFVRLKQTGRFRRSADQPWMPVDAEQTFTTVPPGFVWKARFKVAGLPLMNARDSYQDGHGHMYGKMAGLFTLFDALGAEIDQGSLLRYLGEMIWFPTAFLGENITWQEKDDYNAQVTLRDGEQVVTACISFDAAGRPTNFNAQRYRELDGVYALHSWSVPMTTWEARAGLNIPVRGLVTWKLPVGDLPYYEWNITEVEYNRR